MCDVIQLSRLLLCCFRNIKDDLRMKVKDEEVFVIRGLFIDSCANLAASPFVSFRLAFPNRCAVGRYVAVVIAGTTSYLIVNLHAM